MTSERAVGLIGPQGKIRSRVTRFGRTMRISILRARRRFAIMLRPFPKYYRRWRAILWWWFYRIRHRVLTYFKRYETTTMAISIAFALGITSLWIPNLQERLIPLFVANETFQALRSIFVAVGSALLGAVAIVSSFILFSMQVNVERMPHGLFRSLSSDRRLLGSFVAALPDHEVRDDAAIEIRGRAANLNSDGHWSSSIESSLLQSDHSKLRPLLEELADLISPDTVGQAAEPDF